MIQAASRNRIGVARPLGFALLALIFCACRPVSAQFSSATLRNFFSFASDFSYWPGDMIEGRDGMLYVVLSKGGTNGNGVMYRMDKGGNAVQVLRTFGTVPANPTIVDGLNPYRLFQGRDGYIYSAGLGGGVVNNGSSDGPGVAGDGAIFRIKPDGTGFKNIFTPTNSFDVAALSEDGYFYGVMIVVGTNSTSGSLFRVRTDGRDFQVLASGLPGWDWDSPFKMAVSSDGFVYWPMPYGVVRAMGPYSVLEQMAPTSLSCMSSDRASLARQSLAS